VGLTPPRLKKNKFVMQCYKRPPTWTDSLDNKTKLRKMDMRFGTWNVRNLYRAGCLEDLNVGGRIILKHISGR
jgi:hypothetical protein